MLSPTEKLSSLDKFAEGVVLRPQTFVPLQYSVKGEQKKSWFYPQSVEVELMSNKGLGLEEEAYLLQKIGENNSQELTMPDVHATMAAAFYKPLRRFRNKVLGRSISNGIIVKKSKDEVDIRRVLGANFLDDKILKLSETLQTEVPSVYGYFNRFKGIVPTNLDIKPQGKGGEDKISRGAWTNLLFDDNGLSTIRSCLFNDETINVMGCPLEYCTTYVVPIYSEKNPKR